MYQSHDSTTLLPCRVFKAHKEYLTRLLLSPDIKLLATCSSDHTVRIWKIDMNEEHLEVMAEPSGETVPPGLNHPASINGFMSQSQPVLNGAAAAASTESIPERVGERVGGGDRVVAGGFNPPTPADVRSSHSTGSLTSAPSHSMSASSLRALTDLITLRRPLPCDKVLGIHQRWVWDCAFSADSAYLVTVCSDHYARLWELGTAVVIRQYSGHHRGAVCVALNDYSNPP
jgi:G protein beta subunit-like protein